MLRRSRPARRLWVAVLLVCALVVGAQAGSWWFGSPQPEPTHTAIPQLEEAPLSTEGPAPDGVKLTRIIKKHTKDTTGVVGVSVVDAVTGDELANVDGAKPLAPASSLKILTGAAALESLGADQRWTTRTVAEPADSGPPTVWLVAGGDVMLNPGASDSDEINGRAGVKTLAKDTAKALKKGSDGVKIKPSKKGKKGKKPQVKVGVDARMFAGKALNPDWAKDLITSNNITDVAPLALNTGRDGPHPWSPVVRQPQRAALKEFQQHLEDALGAKVTVVPSKKTPDFDPVSPFTTQKPKHQLASVKSAPVSQQLSYAEAHSDNFMLETYGRLVGIKEGHEGSTQGAVHGVHDVLTKLDVDDSGLVMRDLSGLSPKNRVAPHTLAALLGEATGGDHPSLNLLPTLLPVSGVSGTLENRMEGKKTKALVMAKTGTLSKVISLTGVVTTKDGRPLGFSIIFNDVQGRLDESRHSADQIASALAECGCKASSED